MKVSVKVKTAPTIQPVALKELKDAAKITSCDDDDFLTSIIQSATDGLQRWTGRFFINHTLTLFRDDLLDYDNDYSDIAAYGIGHVSTIINQSSGFDLPYPYVDSVTHIKTYSLANVASTFDAANYTVDKTAGRIWLNDGRSWPSEIRPKQGVEVEYVSGFGSTAASVPPAIRDGIKMYALQMYECRGGCAMSDGCKALVSYYKIHDRLGWQ